MAPGDARSQVPATVSPRRDSGKNKIKSSFDARSRAFCVPGSVPKPHGKLHTTATAASIARDRVVMVGSSGDTRCTWRRKSKTLTAVSRWKARPADSSCSMDAHRLISEPATATIDRSAPRPARSCGHNKAEGEVQPSSERRSSPPLPGGRKTSGATCTLSRVLSGRHDFDYKVRRRGGESMRDGSQLYEGRG